jgi:hypothetical protein
MSTSQLVESYRFWDVVTLWARETLEHEDIVARSLARGVIRDGLRFLSIDPKWIKTDKVEVEFRGYPYIGYCAKPDCQIVVLKAEVLQHLLSIVERAEVPSRNLTHELFVSKVDFRNWLQATNQSIPDFWYRTEAKLTTNCQAQQSGAGLQFSR